MERAPSEKVFGMLAEFETAQALYDACDQVREHEFSAWDAHTPFPIHGLDKAMGLDRSWVSAWVLIMGLGGALAGFSLEVWVSGYAYPLLISGKPISIMSWPAFIPVMFECGVLGGAFGALFGFLYHSELPQHHHALFNSERFERVADDKFFISIQADDPKYDPAETRRLLEELGASHVEVVAE